MPQTEAMLTMAPFPTFSISGISAFIKCQWPFKLVEITRSQSSSVVSRKGSRFPAIPAQLKAQSMRPKVSTPCLTMASTSSLLVTSVRTNMPSPPPFLTIPRVSIPPSSSTSDRITFAPSLANKTPDARPIPLPAPVTSATFPSSMPFMVSSFFSNKKQKKEGHSMAMSVRKTKLAVKGRGIHMGVVARSSIYGPFGPPFFSSMSPGYITALRPRSPVRTRITSSTG